MRDNKKHSRSHGTPNSMMLRRTLFLMIVCGIVAFAVLGIRLLKVQVVDHNYYESMAIDQQMRETTINSSRGTIYDRNKKILAMSASVDTIFLSPKEIEMYEEDPSDIANGLAEILDLDAQKIYDKTQKVNSQYEVIAKKVEPEISDKVKAFKKKGEYKGIHIEEDTKRYYPYGSLAAQMIGFVGADNTGLYGTEKLYDDVLKGTDGRVARLTTANNVGMMFKTFEDYYEAEDGHDIVMTIDQTIQYYLEKHLSQAVRDYDVQHGAVAIAMEVNTGEILGMASLGSFDLNNWQQISEKDQAKIDQEPDEEKKKEMLAEAQRLQWRNKAISDTYEPGSTFKIITLSMALNEGVVSESDHFYCGGKVDVIGREPVNCWKKQGHGDQTLTQALQHSCNVAFVKIGQKVGAEKFYDYCEAFGLFNASDDPDAYLYGNTGIDLLGETKSIWWPRNVFCNPDNMSQLAATSFGQTFNITPLQLITAVSACTNGGYLMQPYCVKEILNDDGTVEKRTEPTVVRQVISEETSATVCEMLEKVVGDPVEGTGKNAYVAGYRIGGKTGTSEKVAQDAAGGPKEHDVSFIGVAPMDDPKIAVLVVLDSPGPDPNIHVSGGQLGAPTVGKIMADVLPYLGYEPHYTDEEEEKADKIVPDIKDLTLDAAENKLKEHGFSYRVLGTGAEVTQQIPAPNSVIASGSQVIIYCNQKPSEAQEAMPNLLDTNYSVAKQKMGELALYIKSSVVVTDPNVHIVAQSIKPGTMIDHGTVVEVTVSDKSNLGLY